MLVQCCQIRVDCGFVVWAGSSDIFYVRWNASIPVRGKREGRGKVDFLIHLFFCLDTLGSGFFEPVSVLLCVCVKSLYSLSLLKGFSGRYREFLGRKGGFFSLKAGIYGGFYYFRSFWSNRSRIHLDLWSTPLIRPPSALVCLCDLFSLS